MSAPITPLDPRVEMFQKGFQDAFFNMKALAPRPMSTATEMYDTDFEDEEESSDIEEGYSPRISLNSAGRRSETTLSSYEELQTPKSNNFQGFDFDLGGAKSVEGPKGPHLFQVSNDSQEDEYHLTMSPLTPRFPRNSRPETAFRIPPIPEPTPTMTHRPISTLTEAVTRLNPHEVVLWTPRQVARWMYNAGFEPAIVEKFEENDISGAILVTLKFEDLRELNIQSFGQRHKLWHEIDNLRLDVAGPSSPTEIDCGSDDDDEPQRKHKHKKKHRKPNFDDIISPLESVSIVGIEQLMPKPHKCAKGENCSRWKKQQRLIEQFKAGHPVSPKGGMILIAGDPGNPKTAEAVRPFSEAQPSVVASSDVLGPGALPPFQHLEEASLASLQTRDPQDNVKQFLNFQHVDMGWSSEEPPTPPYEMFPALQPPTTVQPHHNLRSLPKLAIPGMRPPPRSASANAFVPRSATTTQAQEPTFSPHPMDRAEALSPELRNRPRTRESVNGGSTIYRFGTPASEMDVPLTQVYLGPISRDASQSVPPNMAYRHHVSPNSNSSTNQGPPPARSASRASRRPSYPVPLPRLDENIAVSSSPPSRSSGHSTLNSSHGSSSTRFSTQLNSHPLARGPDDVSHAGTMKKRRTRLLRHEWHEHHFSLRGTHLAMHKDAQSSAVLESIDVDDYAVACSSLASGKLNAAFKAMNVKLSGGEGKKVDEGAFSFQLIPTAIEKGVRLRKRESLMGSAMGGKAGDGKTHHFAVKSRDERIDWMRELMLAKALKQKEEGCEVRLNGNMI